MRAQLAREAARHLQHGALGGVVRDVGHVGLVVVVEGNVERGARVSDEVRTQIQEDGT